MNLMTKGITRSQEGSGVLRQYMVLYRPLEIFVSLQHGTASMGVGAQRDNICKTCLHGHDPFTMAKFT